MFAVNRILALLKLNDYTQAAVPEENLASPQPIFKPYHRLGGGKRTSGE